MRGKEEWKFSPPPEADCLNWLKKGHQGKVRGSFFSKYCQFYRFRRFSKFIGTDMTELWCQFWQFSIIYCILLHYGNCNPPMVRVAKVRMRPDLNHYPPAQFLSHQVNVGSVDTKCTILTPAWHHSYRCWRPNGGLSPKPSINKQKLQ